MSDDEVVDLFSGPRGWDVAAAALGLDPLGLEIDDAACATARAAGFRTVQADVAELDPLTFLNESRRAECEEDGVRYPGDLEAGDLRGLIASPPCQAFSMAGGGAGRRALSAYEEAIERWLEGKPPSREELDEACDDERGHLVLEPLRWTLELRPTWVVLEQVEPVLPLWEAMARGLRRLGYSVWAGVLRAEQYGVPQTRKRAILIARRDGVEARMPPPTHRRYIAPEKRWGEEATDSLFETERGPRVHAEDRDLLPWVSMAEALGWENGSVPVEGQRRSSGPGAARDPRAITEPSYTLRANAGGGSDGVGRSGGIEWVRDNTWSPDDEVGFPRLNDVEGDDGEYRERDLLPATEPAFALTEKARSWTRFRSNSREHATERSVDEPAPTILAGHHHEERLWLRAGTGEPAPTHLDTGASERAGNQPRAVADPAPTITASVDQVPARWVGERPATTVNGDPRISEPGHHDSDVSGSQQANAVRVTIEEAAVLQSFPANYPWQGGRTKVFEQIGNAVPPLLALAVLSEVVSSGEPG